MGPALMTGGRTFASRRCGSYKTGVRLLKRRGVKTGLLTSDLATITFPESISEDATELARGGGIEFTTNRTSACSQVG